MKPKLQMLDQDIAATAKGGIEYICITDEADLLNVALFGATIY